MYLTITEIADKIKVDVNELNEFIEDGFSHLLHLAPHIKHGNLKDSKTDYIIHDLEVGTIIYYFNHKDEEGQDVVYKSQPLTIDDWFTKD